MNINNRSYWNASNRMANAGASILDQCAINERLETARRNSGIAYARLIAVLDRMDKALKKDTETLREISDTRVWRSEISLLAEIIKVWAIEKAFYNVLDYPNISDVEVTALESEYRKAIDEVYQEMRNDMKNRERIVDRNDYETHMAYLYNDEFNDCGIYQTSTEIRKAKPSFTLDELEDIYSSAYKEVKKKMFP